jgi:hypothetical protein
MLVKDLPEEIAPSAKAAASREVLPFFLGAPESIRMSLITTSIADVLSWL